MAESFAEFFLGLMRTSDLYVEIKKLLGLTGCGNSAETFSIEYLAPLIQPGMAVYKELAAAVLAPLMKVE